MSTDPAPGPQSTRLWVRILLAVSLGFNLLVIGAVAGIAVRGGPFPQADTPRHVADATIGPLTRALTKEDRRAIGRELRQNGQVDGWTRRAHRQSMERMVALLQAAPFDAEAFGAELDGTISGLQGRMAGASQALVVRLTEMSDVERAAFAARVRDAMARSSR
ncbi:MAG: periplasmic heavy metal sensor [Pseudomonadota bacterium]